MTLFLKTSLKTSLKTLLKIAFVLLVFWWLGKKNLISIDAFVGGLKNWPQIALGFTALASATLIAAARWGILLRAQAIRIPASRLLQLHFVGNFFNVALPGAVSGDFVKAFYIAKEVPGARARAFGSILFDRILGLSALAFVSLVALLIDLRHFIGSPVLSGVKAFVILAGSSVFIFYTYLFLVRENHDPVLRAFQALERKHPKFGSAVRIYLGVRVYHSEHALVLRTFILACLIHLLAGFACLCFAQALGETQIPANGLFVVVPLGLLVTAIPILPGGVGTGHAAFSFFFQLLGSARGADIFTYYVLVQLFLGALGGLVYLRFKAAAPEMMHELETSST